MIFQCKKIVQLDPCCDQWIPLGSRLIPSERAMGNPYLIGSMYGILTCIWCIFMVNVGKYAVRPMDPSWVFVAPNLSVQKQCCSSNVLKEEMSFPKVIPFGQRLSAWGYGKP